jgi:hypothetical protein
MKPQTKSTSKLVTAVLVLVVGLAVEFLTEQKAQQTPSGQVAVARIVGSTTPFVGLGN